MIKTTVKKQGKFIHNIEIYIEIMQSYDIVHNIEIL